MINLRKWLYDRSGQTDSSKARSAAYTNYQQQVILKVVQMRVRLLVMSLDRVPLPNGRLLCARSAGVHSFLYTNGGAELGVMVSLSGSKCIRCCLHLLDGIEEAALMPVDYAPGDPAKFEDTVAAALQQAIAKTWGVPI